MPADSEIVQGAGHLLFGVQKAGLERLFPVGWLETAPARHPARVRWELCRRMIAQNGSIRLPEQLPDLPLIGRIILDAYLLSQVAGNDWVGTLTNLGDEAVQAKIRTRVLDPGQFEDVMVELTLAGWYLRGKHNAQPLELPRLPDIRVDSSALDLPLFVECKRLWSLARNRLVAEVRDANRQLRNAPVLHYGVAHFDASGALGAVEAPPERDPEALAEVSRVLRSTLGGSNNKSVQTLVVSWDTYHIASDEAGPIMLFFARAARRFNHAPTEGHRGLPDKAPVFNGFTVVLVFGTASESGKGEEAKISDAFREQFGTPLGISDAQFAHIARHPDQRQLIGRVDQKDIILYTHVFTRGREWLSVLVGALSSGSECELLWAVPVPPRVQCSLDGALPLDTLEGLANQYGCLFSIGDHRAHYVFGKRIPIGLSDPSVVMYDIEAPSGAVVVPILIAAFESTPESVVDCGVAFALNMSEIFSDIPVAWKAA
ncbi:MAG: hypothetical protein ABR543_01020 [Gemmatimonadaceae bacterium]